MSIANQFLSNQKAQFAASGDLKQFLYGEYIANQKAQFAASGGFGYRMQKPETHCAWPGCNKLGCDGLHSEVKPKEKTMFDAVKTWFNKHADVIVTVGVLFFVDHLAFGGKFRAKIEAMVEGLIDKAGEKLKAHQA